MTDRRAAILGMLVSEYIATATPVSSQALVERHQLEVSPATIRNELARLEEDGYVTHPYTSAGRMPSDSGYRFYVESLMEEEAPGDSERRTVEHQFHQALGGMDEWLSLAASILAAAVGNVAVVTPPLSRNTQLRQVQLVHLHDATALLVAVLDDGRVRQRIVQFPESTDQAALSLLARRLNDRCAGSPARAIRRAAAEARDDAEAAVARATAELIEDSRAVDGTHLDGVRAVLSQPEFASADRMLEAVRHLRAYDVQEALPGADELSDNEAQVLIGDENASGWMQEWSVVVANYGDRDGALGTVAVLGPTRMQYSITIPRVRYFASLMSDLVHEVQA